MTSRMKRCSYVSDTDSSSYEDGQSEMPYKYAKHDDTKSEYGYKKRRCSSRNAIMARENRIKKKLYLQKLEHEVKVLRKDNSQLNAIVENQSFKMEELQKRIKYMKSMLANSADLQLLMKNIQCSTGMSVTTSLDKNLKLNNDCIPKREMKIARKTAHPWNEQLNISSETSKEPERQIDHNIDSFSELDVFNGEPFSDLLFNLNSLDNYNSDNDVITQTLNSDGTLNEHNYTLTSKYLNDNATMDDVGVCLHVSKHRVSLEFCSSCSENAIETWNTTVE